MRIWAIVPALIAATTLTACGGDSAAQSDADGYTHTAELYSSAEPSSAGPVEVEGTSFLLCTEIELGQPTPQIYDACLVEGYAATSQYGNYSMIGPSVTCPDGQVVTDAGALGIGYVGRPLLPFQGSSASAAIRSACLDQH